MATAWTPSSWQDRAAEQQPEWPDPDRLDRALKQISAYPAARLRRRGSIAAGSLGQVAAGNAFLLQAGDCAESFEEFSADNIREKLRVILQMAVVLTYSIGVPVVKVGRIAGQFAKPRSSATELVGDLDLPSFRGHIVNDPGPLAESPGPRSRPARAGVPPVGVDAEPAARVHQGRLRRPRRACTRGPRSSWRRAREGRRYEQLAGEIDRALRVHAGLRRRHRGQPQPARGRRLHQPRGAASSATRRRSPARTRSPARWYDCSAHMLWIGERTRQLDGAHVEFLRGVGNPIGCKIGPTTTVAESCSSCARRSTRHASPVG